MQSIKTRQINGEKEKTNRFYDTVSRPSKKRSEKLTKEIFEVAVFTLSRGLGVDICQDIGAPFLLTMQDNLQVKDICYQIDDSSESFDIEKIICGCHVLKSLLEDVFRTCGMDAIALSYASPSEIASGKRKVQNWLKELQKNGKK